MMRRNSAFAERVRSALRYIYLLRVQIVGFLLLGPVARWAFGTPLLRGLADLPTLSQVFGVGLVAGFQAIFLVITTNLILLWGRCRLESGAKPAHPGVGRRLWVRRVVSGVGLAFWLSFMIAVRTRSTTGALGFWSIGFLGLGCALFYVLCVQPVLEIFGAVQSLYNPLPIPFLSWNDGTNLIGRLFFSTGYESRRKAPPPARSWLQKKTIHLFQYLGPGYCDYDSSGNPSGTLPGHLLALGSSALVLLSVANDGFAWYYSDVYRSFSQRILSVYPKWLQHSAWLQQDATQVMSGLSMLLSGVFIALVTFSALSFFADRFHVPLFTVMLAMTTISHWVVGGSNFFYSEPLMPAPLDRALTPGKVLALHHGKVIVVAAAGGGIQASGWTAQVLSGLKEDPANGSAFTQSLKVISGVSGGAVGTLFYLGSYDNVWGKAYSPEEARKRAMTSSLPAVAWGLVYPDLNQTLFPIPFFRNIDRGWALERSFAQTAGRYPGPKLLDLAPEVARGLPVFIFNSTLSSQAIPAVFTNSRFPDPATTNLRRGSMRDFHGDFRLETRLETAARLSASFPWVSPAARPSQLKGRDAFLDGGYFDNSGLYSLMGWLEEAAETMPAGGETRQVLLVQIDAFPEPKERMPAEGPVEMSWYNQLAIPFETIVGVRETGQAARSQYEFPLLARSLEGKMKIKQIQFRYRPSPRCNLEQPPLSWHLSELEKDCIREGWEETQTRDARLAVKEWLSAP